MNPPIFIPDSPSFIKKRAQMLSAAFPGISNASALQATAVALGFQSWFDASKRIMSGEKSKLLYDEDLRAEQRLLRRYHQIRAIIEHAEIPADDADRFVRHWRITSHEPSITGKFQSAYGEALADFEAIASGEMSADDYENDRPDYDYGPPKRIAEGIICAASNVKYAGLFLDMKHWLAMPRRLRGEYSANILGEDSAFVVMAFPEAFPPSEVADAVDWVRGIEPAVYDWAVDGGALEIRQKACVTIFKRVAMKHLDQWFAISIRFRTSGHGSADRTMYCPALNGAEYVRFIETGGDMRGLSVQWFVVKSEAAISRLQLNVHYYPREMDADKFTGALLYRHEIEPTMPLYASIFKSRAFADEELSSVIERPTFLLDAELEPETVE